MHNEMKNQDLNHHPIMYSAYLISDMSRNSLLSRFSPWHDDILIHHITICYPDLYLHPPPDSVYVIGITRNKYVDCVVVSINGTTKRPQGGIYHATLSVNRQIGGRSVHSNELLLQGWNDVQPFEINVYPVLLQSRGIEHQS